MNPKIFNKAIDLSVYIPAYNSSKTIEDTLNSIVRQTLQPNKIIVSDNNSTDNTLEIVNKFKKYGVTYIKNEEFTHNMKTNTEKGISNFNFILKKCSTKYLAIYHSDDIYNYNILEEQYRLISKQKNIIAIFTKGEILNKSYNYFKKFINIFINSNNANYNVYNEETLLKDSILKGNPFDFPTMFLNRDILGDILLNNDYEQATDFDFILKCSTKGNIIRINKQYYKRRISDSQDSHFGIERYKYIEKPMFKLLNDKINTNYKYFNEFYSLYLSEKIRCYLNFLFYKNDINVNKPQVIFKQITFIYLIIHKKKEFLIILFFILIEYLLPFKFKLNAHLFIRKYLNKLYTISV